MAKGDEEKRRIREEYEQKVRVVQTQLQRLKTERTAGDALRLEKEATKSTAKVNELESDLLRMKGLQEQLKRRLREREDRHVAAQTQQTKEIAGLRKQSDAQHKRIRELEGVKERQRAALKKKTEELAAAQRKLNALGLDDAAPGLPGDAGPDGSTASVPGTPGGVGSGRKGSARDRAHAYSEQVRLGRRVTSYASGVEIREVPSSVSTPERTSSRPPSAAKVDTDALRVLIDAETSRALRAREGKEERARLDAKRKNLVLERTERVKERDQLALKRERTRSQMEAERQALTKVLDSLDDAVDAGDITPGKVAELRDRRRAAANRLATLHNSLATGSVLPLDDERLLRELEDRIDGMDADLEYVSEALADATREDNVGYGDKASVAPANAPVLIDKIAGMDGREARTALQVALDKVVELRVQERTGQSRLAELEMQLGDAQSAIEEMESGLRMKEMDYDRRVTELQREHSRKEAYLMRLTEAAAAVQTTPGKSTGDTSPARLHDGGATAVQALFPEPLTPDFALGSPGAGSLFEFKEQQIAVLSNQSGELQTQNKDLKRRVKGLLAEREEMDAASAVNEERLESLDRANRSLREHVERLSNAHRRDSRELRASLELELSPNNKARTWTTSAGTGGRRRERPPHAQAPGEARFAQDARDGSGE